MVEFMGNDDEVALLLAHEWSHQLLGHPQRYTSYDVAQEVAADCVGAFLTEKAGYSAERGAAAYLRMQDAERRETLLFAMVGIFGGSAKLDWSQRYERATEVHRRARARPVTREEISTHCGVSP